MTRKTHDVVQGSPEWAGLRARHNCGSEAPSVLGVSSKTSRTELLQMKSTGSAKEFSDWAKSNLLERGHEIEKLARPIAEEIIGDELYPATITDDIDGMRFLVSLDGITMDDSTIWECKSLNAGLRSALKANEIPIEYKPQIEQGLLVSGASRCLFMASDGTKANTFWVWYESDPELRSRLISAWRQFEADLANYVHVEAPAPVAGKVIARLPALNVRLVGEVTESNLAVYQEKALGFIAAINTDLKTDEDFASAELTVKFCGDAEKELETVKAMALEQTATIAELFRVVDSIKESMRSKRLQIEKLVTSRKEAVRAEIRQDGIMLLHIHEDKLCDRLGRRVPFLIKNANFAEVMKGKKTIKSLRSAVSDEVARVKIEMNESADTIEINLRAYRVLAADHEFMFSDLNELLHKPAQDFQAVVNMRIAEYKEGLRKQLEADAQKQAQGTIRTTAPTVETMVGQAIPSAYGVPVEDVPIERRLAKILAEVYAIASNRDLTDDNARAGILDLLEPICAWESAA